MLLAQAREWQGDSIVVVGGTSAGVLMGRQRMVMMSRLGVYDQLWTGSWRAGVALSDAAYTTHNVRKHGICSIILSHTIESLSCSSSSLRFAVVLSFFASSALLTESVSFRSLSCNLCSISCLFLAYNRCHHNHQTNTEPQAQQEYDQSGSEIG